MAKKNVKKGLEEIVELARKLSKTAGMTWVDANNVIYGPDGPVVRLFTTKAERTAYLKTTECKFIDELIDSLPEPPVRPDPREYSGKFNVRLSRALHRSLATAAKKNGVSLNHYVSDLLARGDAQARIDLRLLGLTEEIAKLGENVLLVGALEFEANGRGV